GRFDKVRPPATRWPGLLACCFAANGAIGSGGHHRPALSTDPLMLPPPPLPGGGADDFRRGLAAPEPAPPRLRARNRRTAAQLPGVAARAALAMLAWWWVLALASQAVAQLPVRDLGLVRRVPPVPLAEKLADNLIDTLRPEEDEEPTPPLELMPEEQSPFRKALDLPAGEPLDIDEPSPLEIAIEE